MARKAIPKELRVYMGEAESLPGNPSRQQLHYACTTGCRIGQRNSSPRVYCQSEKWPKRWSTVKWWEQYLSVINEEVDPHTIPWFRNQLKKVGR